jgi:hypothetical protein
MPGIADAGKSYRQMERRIPNKKGEPVGEGRQLRPDDKDEAGEAVTSYTEAPVYPKVNKDETKEERDEREERERLEDKKRAQIFKLDLLSPETRKRVEDYELSSIKRWMWSSDPKPTLQEVWLSLPEEQQDEIIKRVQQKGGRTSRKKKKKNKKRKTMRRSKK